MLSERERTERPSNGIDGKDPSVDEVPEGVACSLDVVELIRTGQLCANCGFAKVERIGRELVCPICGYGNRPCT
jgi:hypothetical protein